MEDAEAPETAETGDAAFLGPVFWRVHRWKTYIFKPQHRIKHKIQLVSFSFRVRRQSCVLFWNKFPFDYF